MKITYNKVMTAQMVRDYLWHRGPKSTQELSAITDTPNNVIMSVLLLAEENGAVAYDPYTGKWECLTRGSC